MLLLLKIHLPHSHSMKALVVVPQIIWHNYPFSEKKSLGALYKYDFFKKTNKNIPVSISQKYTNLLFPSIMPVLLLGWEQYHPLWKICFKKPSTSQDAEFSCYALRLYWDITNLGHLALWRTEYPPVSFHITYQRHTSCLLWAAKILVWDDPLCIIRYNRKWSKWSLRVVKK